MDNANHKCSTPAYGRKTIDLDLTLSEIRNTNGQSGEVESLSSPKRKSKQREILARKKYKSTKIFNENYDSDSDYETVDVYEICYQEFENESCKNIDSDNSPNLSPQLFRSPSDKNYDNYEKLYLKSLEDHTLSISSNPSIVTSSPVFQDRFRDETELKTYSRSGFKTIVLSPSKISFSPKWLNRVAPKYNSPSDIPSRDETLQPLDKSPESEESSKTFSYGAENMIFLSKSTTFIGKQSEDNQPTASKYSHLRVQNDRYKRFISPTRKLDSWNKENGVEGRATIEIRKHRSHDNNATLFRATDNNDSKAETRIFGNESPDIQTSRSAAKNKVKSSSKNNAIDSSRHLGETLKRNDESILITDHCLSKIGSTLPKKSKPKIRSVEIIKRSS